MTSPVSGVGYGANSYGYNLGANNDDFMSSAYFNQLYGQNGSQYSQTGAGAAGASQKTASTDTFEKQGSSNIGTGLLLGTGAGAAAGYGLYKTGWQMSPVGEKELAKGFANEFSSEYLKIMQEKYTKEVLTANGNLKPEVLKELKDFAANTDDKFKLSKEAKDYLSNKKIAAKPDEVEKLVDGIEKQISAKVDPINIAKQNEILTKAENLQKGFRDLADKKQDTLKKFLADNREEFGITGKNTKEINTNIQKYIDDAYTAFDPAKKQALENKLFADAKKLGLEGKDTAETWKNVRAAAKERIASATMGKHINGKVKVGKAGVEGASDVLDEVFHLWNKDKNAFRKSASTEITQACRKGLSKFKLKRAGLIGAGVAAAVAVGAWLFGGTSAPKTA